MAKKAPAPAKRPRGRPAKPEAQRKRGILAMRIRDEMKATLSRRAAENQRSVSEEAEALLEQALQTPAVLDQALDLAFGRQVSGLILALARVARDISINAAVFGSRSAGNTNQLFNSPYVFHQISEGMALMLEAMYPTGQIETPDMLAKIGISSDSYEAAFVRNLGTVLTNEMLVAIAGYETARGDYKEWAVLVREKLGAEVVQRIGEFTHVKHPRGGADSEQPKG